MAARVQRAKAVLFDLHNTISYHISNPNETTRSTAKSVGLHIDHCTDEDLHGAITKAEEWHRRYQVRKGVDMHWGDKPEHWTGANRIMFKELGHNDLSDEILVEMERRWKRLVNSPEFEVLADDSKSTLTRLHDAGYKLGVCTRRYDDPAPLLAHWGIDHLLSTVHYTGVPGYAKPSPYTLLRAAEDIGLNPRLCLYVGNYVGADVEAAIRAEMVPVLLTWANPSEEKKAPAGTIILDRPGDLLDLLLTT
jgi:phosphoglycolate phosphatase-like HAD superfamily hydrolase